MRVAYAIIGIAMSISACSADEREATIGVPRIELIPERSRTLDFTAGAGLAWVDDTTLAVVDVDNRQVVLATSSSERRIGRQGSGPGEMQTPSDAIVRDGKLLVSDAGLLRLTAFSMNGDVIASAPIPGMPLRILDWTEGMVEVAWAPFGMSATGPAIGKIDLATGKAEVLVHPWQADPSLAAQAPGSQGAGTIFLATAGAGDDAWLAGVGYRYRISRINRRGGLDHTLGRPDVLPQQRSPAETEALLASTRRMIGNRADAKSIESVVRGMADQPKPYFLLNSLETDADGKAWVITTRIVDSATEVDIFDVNGKFIGTVRLRGDVRRIAFGNGQLAVLALRLAGDVEGQHGVDVYRIAE